VPLHDIPRLKKPSILYIWVNERRALITYARVPICLASVFHARELFPHFARVPSCWALVLVRPRLTGLGHIFHCVFPQEGRGSFF